MEYVRQGRNHHGGLVAACRDIVTLTGLITRAFSLVYTTLGLAKKGVFGDGPESNAFIADLRKWLDDYNQTLSKPETKEDPK
jgi:hypothetical protein